MPNKDCDECGGSGVVSNYSLDSQVGAYVQDGSKKCICVIQNENGE